MRYIRTEDGRIRNRNKLICYAFEEDYFSDDWDKAIEEFLRTKIIKQADTIEELCDELVVHNPSNDGVFYPKHFVYQNKWETMLKPMRDYQKSKGVEIYGANWTDKGLIYVAKMNEKGQLESYE